MNIEKKLNDLEKIVQKLLTKEISPSTGKYLSGIILYHPGSNAVLYDSNDAGLDTASAAAVSGDRIIAQGITFSAFHTLKAGVEYYTSGSLFESNLVVDDGAKLYNANIIIVTTSAISAVSLGMDSIIRDSSITIISTDTAVGISTTTPLTVAHAWNCYVFAFSSTYGTGISGSINTHECEIYGWGNTSGIGIVGGLSASYNDGGSTNGTHHDVYQYSLDAIIDSTYHFSYGSESWYPGTLVDFPWSEMYWSPTGGFTTPGCLFVHLGRPASSIIYGEWYLDVFATIVAGDYIKAKGFITSGTPDAAITLCAVCDGVNQVDVDYTHDAWFELNINLTPFAGQSLTQVFVSCLASAGIPGPYADFYIDNIEIYLQDAMSAKPTLNAVRFNSQPEEEYYISAHGDRSAWDITNYDARHASDIASGVLLRHLPAPGTAGNVVRDDGDEWESVNLATAGIVGGTGTVGRIPQWAAGGATIEDSNLACTVSGGIATISGAIGADHSYALPAMNGTFALLEAENVFTATQNIIDTTEQLRLGYDVSNYLSITVGATGTTTFNTVGTSPDILFSDNVGIGVSDALANLHISGTSIFERPGTGLTAINNYYNPDTTNGNGVYYTYQGNTTGAGASTRQEFGRLAYKYTIHDHATRTSEIYFQNYLSGALTSALILNATEAVFNDGSNDVNFRVESNGNTNMFLVDGGLDRVAIGISTPSTVLHIAETTGAVVTISRNDGSVTTQDWIGGINFDSNDATLTTNFTVAAIKVQASATYGTDAAPGILSFLTTGTTAGGSPIEVARFSQNQHMIIGSVNDVASDPKLQVCGDVDVFSDSTLGSELIANGTFDSDTTGWTGVNATLDATTVPGKLTITQTTSTSHGARQAITTVVGKRYKLTVDYFGTVSSGSSFIRLQAGTTSGGTDLASQYMSVSGIVDTSIPPIFFIATSTTTYIQVTCGVGVAGSYTVWDNVSCKECLSGSLYLRGKLLNDGSYGYTVSGGDFNGEKAGITVEGGHFIMSIAGENLARGEVVYIGQGGSGADGKVHKNPIDGDMPVGIVYQAANADAPVKIVVAGYAYVLPNAADTATRGYVIYSSSTTAGRVDQASTVPAALVHFREIGHWAYTGSGAGAITLAIIHFN